MKISFRKLTLLIMESVKVMRSHGTSSAGYLCMIEAVIDQGRVLLLNKYLLREPKERSAIFRGGTLAAWEGP